MPKARTSVVVSTVLTLFFAFHTVAATSPCTDSLLIELKKKNIDSLSQRQYEYLMLYQKNCLDEKSASTHKLAAAKIGVTFITDDSYKGRGYIPEVSVHVNDINYGKPEKILSVPPGKHSIALFSQKAFESANVHEKKRMQNAFVNVEIESGAVYQLIFIYKCDTGKNRHCAENEWFFANDFKRIPR